MYDHITLLHTILIESYVGYCFFLPKHSKLCLLILVHQPPYCLFYWLGKMVYSWNWSHVHFLPLFILLILVHCFDAMRPAAGISKFVYPEGRRFSLSKEWSPCRMGRKFICIWLPSISPSFYLLYRGHNWSRVNSSFWRW